jgi:hypothetical protein
MAKAPGIDIEGLFVPELDLTAYETMETRELYLSLMKGVFAHQGLPTDERTLIPRFAGMYVTAPRDVRTYTDEEIRVGEEDSQREVRIRTSAVKKRYAGIGWPWGPKASVALSTVENGKVVELFTGVSQEHQDLFLSAFLNVRNPLNGKRLEKEKAVVPPLWAGNTNNTSEPVLPRDRIKESAFRSITPAKKRVLGVSIEALGQLAAVRI